MKQLTCEMCGSTDMIKQDGVFICQTCGMKYTVEEANLAFADAKKNKNIKTLLVKDIK